MQDFPRISASDNSDSQWVSVEPWPHSGTPQCVREGWTMQSGTRTGTSHKLSRLTGAISLALSCFFFLFFVWIWGHSKCVELLLLLWYLRDCVGLGLNLGFLYWPHPLESSPTKVNFCFGATLVGAQDFWGVLGIKSSSGVCKPNDLPPTPVLSLLPLDPTCLNQLVKG